MKTMLKDQAIIDIFIQHDGLPLEVKTIKGNNYKVWNIAWGYDMEAEYAHITSNISPFIAKASSAFFFTNEIVSIFLVDTNEQLFEI